LVIPPVGDLTLIRIQLPPTEAETPPSTAIVCPVTKLEASLARNNRGPFNSEGLPTRAIGASLTKRSRNSGTANQPAVISLGNQPGAMALTRTLRSAQLAARLRVRLITAPLLVW